MGAGKLLLSAVACLVFVLPVVGQKQKLILDADTANEIDDMYAIARMLKQEKFEVLALTSTQWIHYLAEEDSVGASQRENEAMVKLLGREDLPVPKGSAEPMGKPWGGSHPKDSPAARFIIKSAKAASPENKIKVVCMGATTNLASAIAMEPEIAANIEAYLLGFKYNFEDQYWDKSEFNIRRDLNAADYVLNCKELELSVMPTSVAKALVFKQGATFANHEKMGELGDHLTKKWKARFEEFDTWVMWDLALVEAIVQPEFATRVDVTTPPENVQRKVSMYKTIDVERMRQDYWSVVLPRSPDGDASD